MSDLIDVVNQAFRDDPEGAEVLLDEVAQNYIYDILADDEDAIQEMLADEYQRRNNIAKAALGRAYVETISKGEYPDAEVTQTAHWLAHMDGYIAEVRKGAGRRLLENWFIGGQQQPRYVSRDSQGRFTKVVDTGQSTVAVSAQRVSPALMDRYITSGDKGRELNAEGQKREDAINRHQAQYEQADEHVRDLYRLFGGDSKGIRLRVDYMRGRKVSQTPLEFDLHEGRKGIPDDQIAQLNPADDTILSVSVDATPGASDEAKARVQRFHSFNVVGDQALAERTMGSWEGTFGRRNPNDGKAARSWQRANAASAILNATGNVKAAEFARLVGAMGPEAEKVFGPYLQQAAYRYRGTEKSPDRRLLEEFKSVDMQAINAGALPEVDEGRNAGIVMGSYGFRRPRAMSGDQLKLQVRSDVAAANLVRTLPTDPFTARLSEKSGHVLPSQGVIINAEGEVVSQAVGYADDHYLPFDLKNLTALRGGQYVRTRVSGGLTGEDIYAAVQSGARMATVISTSGVFSIEFDPNFRGARGNSDKARSMYERYLKILDAVDNSGMYLKDVSPAVYEEADAYARSIVSDTSTKDGKREYEKWRDKFLDDARRDQRSGYDVDELLSQAKEQAAKEGANGRLTPLQLARREADIYEDLRYEYQADKVQDLSLNAAGYDMALKTLQQQFPYFIRKVDYQPLSSGRRGKDGAGFLDSIQAPAAMTNLGSFVQSDRRKDSGYVKPGGLRPDSVESGFYETAEPMRRKTKGATEDRSGSQGGEKSKTEGAEGAGSTGNSASSAPESKKGASVEMPLLRKLSNYGALTQREAQQSLGKLVTPLQMLGSADRQNVEPVGGALMTWDAAKDTDQKVIMAQYLLSHHGDLANLLKDEKAVNVLGDREAVTQAFSTLYTRGLQDELSSDPAIRQAFGGANTSTEAIQFVMDRASEVSNRYRLDRPFNEGDGSNPFYEGDRPMAFPDMMRLDSTEKLNNWMQHDGARIAQALKQVGDNPNDTIPAMVKLLRTLNDDTQGFRIKAAEDANGDPDLMKTSLARMVGLKPEELAAVLGTTVSGLGASTWSPDAVARRADQLQRAWTLWQTQRILDLIGGGSPKVPVPQSGLMSKSERSSRPVVVLPQSHPMALTVLLNKAAGRPLLSQ